jgi:hypothetical protein
VPCEVSFEKLGRESKVVDLLADLIDVEMNPPRIADIVVEHLSGM